jgi:hypothetical protein
MKGAFVGEKNFYVIKMHGTTVKEKGKIVCFSFMANLLL